ncbi:MAG: efflux RND transporter periplasmic adaptor subunit, partial [Ignavibacteriaceae bacterium]|nr:efflux RND transporter periplasmic adaptor subunit [Ignavibacteriaceae bacterium]
KVKKKILIIIITAVVLLVPVYFLFISGGSSTDITLNEKQLYTCGMHPDIISDEPGNCPICGMKLVPVKNTSQSDSPQKKERKILYWRAPMDPNEIYNSPGKSKMGMDLVPVYEDETSGTGIVSIDPQVQQNMNIKTAKVEVKQLSSIVTTNGVLTTNETSEYIVTTRINGWVEKLYVNYTGQQVLKGFKLMEIYSPELVSAQQELLTALSYQNSVNGSSLESIKQSGNELVKNAMKKLELLEVPETEINRLINMKEVKTYLTLFAQKTGTVLEKNIIEGQKISEGMPLLKISNLSNLWLMADIYEYELAKVKVGSKVSITFNFLPGKTYDGKVSFIYPTLDPKSRTVKIRIELNNRGELKPSMFANITIQGEDLGKKPVIPENAVIHSGMKDIVIISLGDGKFKPQEVQLGGYSDGYYQVISGLTEGNTIVTSAQFLIDSESNLKAAINQFQSTKQDTVAMLNMKEEKPEMKNEKQELPDAKNNHSSSIVREGVIDVNSIDKNNDDKLWECPMDWNVISDESGICPVCNMKLKEFSIDEVKTNLTKNGYEHKK